MTIDETASTALAEIHAMADRAIAEINLKVNAWIRSDAQRLRRWKEANQPIKGEMK